MEKRKTSSNQKQIFHKILFSPWPDSPSHIPGSYSEIGCLSIPHAHTVKLEGCTDAGQRNGGKHATFDPPVRVAARPAETSERGNIVKMIRSDSTLPPQTGSQVDDCSKLPVTVRQTLSPAFKHTVGAGQD